MRLKKKKMGIASPKELVKGISKGGWFICLGNREGEGD